MRSDEGLEIDGFNVAAVYVDDLEKALNFYERVLGFKKVAEVGAGVQLHLDAARGGLSIYLQGGYSRDSREYDVSKISLCFHTPSIRATLRRIRELGVPVNLEYLEVAPNYAMFCVLDPAGNQIMFTGKP